ncbi:hypothetical protein IFR10_08510 [Bacillus sp. CFBP 13597]|nr:hypothetical protein [Bacillus sp. CFBP 13597]
MVILCSPFPQIYKCYKRKSILSRASLLR